MGISAGIVHGIVAGIAGGILTVIVATRAYYHLAHVVFVWPKTKGGWYLLGAKLNEALILRWCEAHGTAGIRKLV